MNLFLFSMRKPTWKGVELSTTDLTYGQLVAGRQMWSDAKFLRSSEDSQKRHYLIQGSTPSATPRIALVLLRRPWASSRYHALARAE